MKSDIPWPFDQAQNVAAVTTREVVDGSRPVLLVQHLSEDHSWAFLDSQSFDATSAILVGMAEVVEIDPTLLEIADLPPGWMASRTAVNGAWSRERSHDI